MRTQRKTPQDKIEYLANKIGNLHKNKLEELEQFVNSNIEMNCSNLYSKFINGWKCAGIHTKEYWLNRGWSNSESIFKAKSSAKKIKRPSPFSIEFYLDKINPNTGEKYTSEEADRKRNSHRPIRKEYWMERGHSEDESILLALETKMNNNIKGAEQSKNRDKGDIKSSSIRCKEYYMLRGYDEDEAVFLVSKSQSTFSLQKCIEKYGEIEGYRIWKERQIKWQDTLNSKSKEEISEINRRKRSKSNQNSISNPDSFKKFYLIEISFPQNQNSKIYYKIGITKRSINSRYQTHINYGGTVNEILCVDMHYSDAIKLENDIILNFHYALQNDNVYQGYTECFDPNLITEESLKEYIETHESYTKTNIRFL
jgi:hypothetical protein